MRASASLLDSAAVDVGGVMFAVAWRTAENDVSHRMLDGGLRVSRSWLQGEISLFV